MSSHALSRTLAALIQWVTDRKRLSIINEGSDGKIESIASL